MAVPRQRPTTAVNQRSVPAPRANSRDARPQSPQSAPRTSTQGDPVVTPGQLDVSTSKGYYVTLPGTTPTVANSNAFFSMGKRKVYLWVNEIQAGFSVGGSFSQCARSRTWFARNFNDPTFTIIGQFSNQLDYQNLAEFIRQSHFVQLNGSGPAATMGFTLLSGGVSTTAGQNITTKARKGHATKGTHAAYNLRGYVSHVERTAERYVNAPSFRIEMIVAGSSGGLYNTELDQVSMMSDWTQILSQGNFFNPDKQGQAKTPTDTSKSDAKSGNSIATDIGTLLGTVFGGGREPSVRQKQDELHNPNASRPKGPVH